jgi:AcrR family transcriptional regulator
MPEAPDLSPPRRRADAERSVTKILDAAVEALASDPEARMAGIARRAGVVRATVYVHFPTREALIAAVTQRAISEVAAVIEAAEPDRGEPAEALARLVSTAWRTMGRYHSLVAINSRLPQAELQAEHGPVLDRLEPLIARGQADGVFRADVPAAWHLAVVLALVHTASATLQAGHGTADQIESALVETVLGAMGVRTYAEGDLQERQGDPRR